MHEQITYIVRLFTGIINSNLISEHILYEASKEGRIVSGLILNTFGAGNAPTNTRFLDNLQKISAANITMVNVSQATHGKVSDAYATGSALSKIGVINAKDIIVEAAHAKPAILSASHTDIKK